ncbi:pectate lyase [Marinimicrobium agarilyticum]|uniref:pectate lyase n=1 Tax=Marinimicrobium agarilyticum TaxID=306546 RepID=UPI00040E8172|nr:pectate lyase [Marinimicrobium agarilyticum]
MRCHQLRWALLGAALTLFGCETPTPEPKHTINVPTSAWEDYQARSQHWRSVDRDQIQAEMAAEGLDEPKPAPKAHRNGFDPDQPITWYASEEGQRIADIILSFQTPSGGWSKGTDMTKRPRQPAQAFGVERKYVPTFDNNATSTQIRALAKAYSATGEPRYREGYVKGVELILEAQYPNGGWPQTFPLRGGYHDYITFNDDAMINLMAVLSDIAKAEPPFEQAPEDLRVQAARSMARGLDLIVAAQVVVDGKPTLWGAQHDPRTLEPRKARAYEMVSLATAESADLLEFLMQLENPPADIQAAVHHAVDWYRSNPLKGVRWDREAYRLVKDKDASPLWSRFAEIGTNRPLFGDRDNSVHYDIDEISQERREGYAWYTNDPSDVLEQYQQWRQRYPR